MVLTLQKRKSQRLKQHFQALLFSMKTTYQTLNGIGNRTIMKFHQSHLLLEMALNSHRIDFELNLPQYMLCSISYGPYDL